MKLSFYTRGDVVVLEPVGKILPGPDVGELNEKLYSLFEKGQSTVIIDLSHTAWICSSALSVLLYYSGKSKETGCSLKLVNLTGKIQEVIAIAKVGSLLDVYNSLEAALDSCKNQKIS